MTKPIGAIVLAAGYSKRFGDSKLLAQLHNGKTVVQQTLERIAEVFPQRLSNHASGADSAAIAPSARNLISGL